ncbi:MAG: phage tail sheath subtilisin-like domain-containing protein, partial [Treponemataceae bacterium]
MAIPFTQIPDSLLVPGSYQEIDNSLAGSSGEVKRVLLIGTKTQTGEAVSNKPINVVSSAKAKTLCGHGSPLALMAEA